MLKAALRALGQIRPSSVLALAREAGVSVETLVRRMGQASSLLDDVHFRGCIVLAKSTADGQTIVSAITKPKQVDVARDLQLMRPGETWQLLSHNGSSIEPAGLPSFSSTTLTFETHHAAFERVYEVAKDRLGEFNGNIFHLLTFEQTEP